MIRQLILGMMLAALPAFAQNVNGPLPTYQAMTTSDGLSFSPIGASSGGAGTVSYPPAAIYVTCPVSGQPGKYGPCTFSGGGGDTITSPGSTISVGGTATATTLDLNLAHANTWSVTQTFSGVLVSGLTASAQVTTDASKNLTTIPLVANITVTVSTSSVAANSCNPSLTTFATTTMTGLASTNTLLFTPNASTAAISGWTPATPGLYFNAFPTTNTLNWQVCNSTASPIVPGSSTTWNVSAK